MTLKYLCRCGTECREDELETVCTFYATLEEPAEYDAKCPDCGTNWENMEEVIDEQISFA
jgi:hypothetical protein